MTLESLIQRAWDNKEHLRGGIDSEFNKALHRVISLLDQGQLRIAEKIDGIWTVHEWLKKAVLLSFRLFPNIHHTHPTVSYDKVPLKFEGWQEEDFKQANIRVVPGAIVRCGSFLGKDVVVMPSFINIGSYIGAGTMIDSYATVGSCAQVGKNCHISANVLLGGVLEPLQAKPVIVEDHCFIGARCDLVEGALIEEGAVLGMGVAIGASTPIVDRATHKIMYGRIPAYSVVVPGSLPSKDGSTSPGLACAVIVKTVTPETRAKTSLNELLRAS